VIPVGLVDLSKNRAARWGAAVAIAVVSLWLARCDGAHRRSARDRQDAADAQATASENAAKAAAKAGDSVRRLYADSMKDLRIAKAKADSDATHALAHLGTITVIHSAPPTAPRGETALGGSSSAPEPDTTKRATIQRAGDPQLYVVPQFVVDLGAELRRSLVEKSDEAAKAERNLAIVSRLVEIDSNTIRDLRGAIASRTTAEGIAKSNARQDCRLLPFVPCPPRWLMFVAGGVGGGILGYELAKR
jgi:hypothetical protein